MGRPEKSGGFMTHPSGPSRQPNPSAGSRQPGAENGRSTDTPRRRLARRSCRPPPWTAVLRRECLLEGSASTQVTDVCVRRVRPMSMARQSTRSRTSRTTSAWLRNRPSSHRHVIVSAAEVLPGIAVVRRQVGFSTSWSRGDDTGRLCRSWIPRPDVDGHESRRLRRSCIRTRWPGRLRPGGHGRVDLFQQGFAPARARAVSVLRRSTTFSLPHRKTRAALDGVVDATVRMNRSREVGSVCARRRGTHARGHLATSVCQPGTTAVVPADYGRQTWRSG